MGVGGVGLVPASALRGGTDGGTAGMQQQNGGVCVWLECVQFSDSVTQPTPPPRYVSHFVEFTPTATRRHVCQIGKKSNQQLQKHRRGSLPTLTCNG